MKITSTSITEGQPIELAYAHADAGGKNISPQLSWTPGPEGTKSYAITIYDPDAPTGSGFWHWILADIPADVTSWRGRPAARWGTGVDQRLPGGGLLRRLSASRPRSPLHPHCPCHAD